MPSRRGDAIERSLADLSATLGRSLFAEQISHREGLLQRLDARVKIASTVAFLVAVGLSRNLAVIAGLYAVLLVLARASAVPMGTFVKRVWLVLPFFTALVALPALFLTPGPPLAALPLGITVTRSGAAAALFLLLRVGASISAGILLVLTTPWNTVLQALGALRVPDVAVLILGMTYRYLDLFLRLASDLFQARKSRLLVRPSGRAGRELVASSAGVLLSSSLQMSGEVYLAMASRGFRGAPRTMDRFRMRGPDWAFAAGALLLSAAAVWLGR